MVSHKLDHSDLSLLGRRKPNLNLPLSNGSVTLVEYEDGKLTVVEIAVTVGGRESCKNPIMKG